MLSRVAIKNFKSIGEPGVDLAPLTFLVGPNGGGKSSIMEAIAVADIRGVQSDSETKSNHKHFDRKDNTVSIELDLSLLDTQEKATYILESTGSDHVATFSPQGPGRRIKFDDTNARLRDGEDIFDSHFFNRLFPLKSTRQTSATTSTAVKAHWVGENGEDTLDILDRLGSSEFVGVRKKIGRWAETFGMPDVGVSHVKRQTIEGSYRDSIMGVPLSISVASSGSRQVLPIIVQLFWSDRGSLITIEEPEISLHPQAQVDVIEMFAEAIKKDKQIIAATHSVFMLQGVGYGIIKGWLKPDQVAVYHVEKKKDVGTIAKRLPMTEHGLIKGWILSFSRVERKLVMEWLETLPEN